MRKRKSNAYIRRTLSSEKSQCSMITSMSATLPGTGLGGYATLGGRGLLSIYTRLGPVPFVSVTVGRLNLVMAEYDVWTGRAGLPSACCRPTSSGTAEVQVNDSKHQSGRRISLTLASTWIMSRCDLPLPNLLYVFSSVHQGRRIRERRWPGFVAVSKASMSCKN